MSCQEFPPARKHLSIHGIWDRSVSRNRLVSFASWRSISKGAPQPMPDFLRFPQIHLDFHTREQAHQPRRLARRRLVGERACRRPFRLDHRFACGHHYMIFYDTQAHTERVHHTFEHLLIPIAPGQSIADRPHSALPSRPRLPQHEISRRTLALQITAHPPNPINHSSDTPPSPTNPPIPAPNIARTAVTAHPLIPQIPVQTKVNHTQSAETNISIL